MPAHAFTSFIAIDWSGARGPFLPGLQVAICRPGSSAPSLVAPPSPRGWRRSEVVAWLHERVQRERVLIGMDFSFAYPYCDRGAYLPGHPASPADAPALWEWVERICAESPEFYAGPCYLQREAPFAEYLCTQRYTGTHYAHRQRESERACAARITTPSCTCKCVGPDGVGSGSLAGMRVLHHLRTRLAASLAIWPFDAVDDQRAVLVEIFPRLYFHLAGQDPRRWAERGVLAAALARYGADPLPADMPVRREDDADALLSAAALRHLAAEAACWGPAGLSPCARRYEGWIFGVVESR